MEKNTLSGDHCGGMVRLIYESVKSYSTILCGYSDDSTSNEAV